MIKNDLQPMVTEKASQLGVYTFAIHPSLNKPLVKKLIQEQYKVTPTRVNIINNPAKKIMMRGQVGTRPAVKKAMVYLKPGDTITIVEKKAEKKEVKK